MKSFAYVVIATPMSGVSVKTHTITGTVTCDSIQEAIDIILDDDHDSWELKHCFKEIISLVRLP